MAETVHLSDGKSVLCGAKNVTAVLDVRKGNCSKCVALAVEQAKEAKDPYIKVQVLNKDLEEGVDWAFTYENKTYHLINNGVGLLRKSVAEHLRHCYAPVTRYVSGQEEGRSIQTTGKRHRFIVTKVA